ncbi:MAG: HTTM domain-containing protein, partial [Planctomycetota bacterium]
GIFPWFMLFATPILLPPAIFRIGPRLAPKTNLWWSGLSLKRKQWTVALLATYLIIQLLVPFRHFLYAGDCKWTEEASRFSWRMKIRSKFPAWPKIRLTDPVSGESWVLQPDELVSHLVRSNLKKHRKFAEYQVTYMSIKPRMLLQFSHYLAERYRKEKGHELEVRAEVRVRMNGREAQLLVDPSVDLAKEPYTLGHASWIQPLTVPLRKGTP